MIVTHVEYWVRCDAIEDDGEPCDDSTASYWGPGGMGEPSPERALLHAVERGWLVTPDLETFCPDHVEGRS